MELGGLHHVTAVTSQASHNVAFYTQVLGLRLVKKTVNQDDVTAYHLFYADRLGHPGTDLTFFDWAFATRHRPGAGQVGRTGLRVHGWEALEWWRERFDRFGAPHGDIREEAGRLTLMFTDPEGQQLALVDDTVPPDVQVISPGEPWEKSPIPRAMAIRGLASVTLHVRALSPTERLLTDVLGFRYAGSTHIDDHNAGIYDIGPGGPGAVMIVVERPDLRQHRPIGAGGVHHVAFRTPDEAQHARWREKLTRAGVGVTPIIDRFYFRSMYFREPGGVLFEIATDGPGFAVDEAEAHLGEQLSLPPFLEPRRAEIEASLRPITPVAIDPVGT